MPRHETSAVVIGLLIAGWCLSPASAASYTRTKTCGTFGTPPCERGQTPKPLAWPKRCVRYRVDRTGSDDFERTSAGQIGSELRALVRSSFETWNRVSCSDFAMLEGELIRQPEVGYWPDRGYEGNTNVVTWRDDEWPYASRSTLALTSVTYKPQSAESVDTDIEFNSALYDFAHLRAPGRPEGKVDLLNTLTHEAGHVLGLAHSSKPEATMYGSVELGDVSKRDLLQDDVEGLCAVYPKRQPAATCDDPEDFRPPQEPDAGSGGDAGTGDASGRPGQRSDARVDVGDDWRDRYPSQSEEADDDNRGCRCETSRDATWPPFGWGLLAVVVLVGRRRQATSSKRSP